MNTTASTDYWSLLGLEPNSDENQLKRAFRREARKWHPDLNKNDRNAEERFKLINEAYAILSDPNRRKIWENKNKKNADPFSYIFPTYYEYVDYILGLDLYPGKDYYPEKDDIYTEIDYNKEEDVFDDDNFNLEDDPSDNLSFDNTYSDNKPTTSNYSPPPVKLLEDLETVIEITPDESLYGTSVEVELENGTLIEVETPPFAGDGWRLRIAGSEIGLRDHFIHLKVETEDGLRIDGLRVLYRLELYPHDALLGCAVDIPTLLGTVTLQVPPSSSSGRLLRLRGRGLEFDNIKGDQIVEIMIILPMDPTDSELALYSRLKELSN